MHGTTIKIFRKKKGFSDNLFLPACPKSYIHTYVAEFFSLIHYLAYSSLNFFSGSTEILGSVNSPVVHATIRATLGYE